MNEETEVNQPDEERLIEMLEDVADDYRLPPGDPPLDAMWATIEARAFPRAGGAKVLPLRTPWRRWLPLAATLAIGVGLGRWTVGSPSVTPPSVESGQEAAATAVRPVSYSTGDHPFAGVATDYLEQSTAFILTLTTEIRAGRPLRQSVPQARDLLATTRLLLDAPGARDQGLNNLLEDLELLLAQIVQLPSEAAPEANLIREALAQREVLPRLQLLLADAHPSY